MDSRKLERQIEEHRLWLESRRLQGTQAVFRGQDLRFASLAGKRLNECVLAGSNLERADLSGVSLAGADLRKANLAYANLSGANLSGANLSGALMEGAVLDNAELREALFEDVQCDSASLKNASLIGVRGARATFNRSDLSSADLDAASFEEAQFTSANLTQASLREAVLDRANLRSAVLSGAQVDGTSLRDANLIDAILVGVSFETSNIEGARMDRNAMAGGAQDAEAEKGDKSKDAKGSARPFSGTALAPNVSMAQLLRRRDELQQELRAFVLQGRPDDEAHQAKLSELRAALEDIEAQQRVLRQEVRRGEEYGRSAQAELQGRVNYATRALRTGVEFTNRQLQRAHIWSVVCKVWGLSLLALGGFWLVAVVYYTGGAVGGESGWLAIALVFFGAGFALLILDHFNTRFRQPLIERRDRVDDVIATLNAAQRLSADVETNQRNITSTFETARDKLLGQERNGEQR